MAIFSTEQSAAAHSSASKAQAALGARPIEGRPRTTKESRARQELRRLLEFFCSEWPSPGLLQDFQCPTNSGSILQTLSCSSKWQLMALALKQLMQCSKDVPFSHIQRLPPRVPGEEAQALVEISPRGASITWDGRNAPIRGRRSPDEKIEVLKAALLSAGSRSAAVRPAHRDRAYGCAGQNLGGVPFASRRT